LKYEKELTAGGINFRIGRGPISSMNRLLFLMNNNY
jgi:hypothetical protein